MDGAGPHGVKIAAVALLVGVTGCSAQPAVDSAGADLCHGTGASPAVTDPATRPIAFTSDRSGSLDLWLMGSDGSDEIRLTTAPDVEALPSWSPDGKRLAFMSAADLESSGDICVINADGTGLQNLTDTADVFETTPSWSPDGTQIAYVTWSGEDHQIHVMDSDGSGSRLVASDGNWPSWSPDSERIVFGTGRGTIDQDLWIMNRDGSGQVPLADGEGELNQPAWSPDGQTIAFVSATGDPDATDPVKWNEDIFLMATDGGPARRITTLPGNEHWPPAWFARRGTDRFHVGRQGECRRDPGDRLDDPHGDQSDRQRGA
jgi:Tol biopolymer transport system component